MNHRRLPLILLMWCSLTATVYAQDKLPPRLQSFAQTGPMRLTRILGTPEIQRVRGSGFSADGSRLVFVEDMSIFPDDDEAQKVISPIKLRSRLHIWETKTRAWPREVDLLDKSISSVLVSNDGKSALLIGTMHPGKDWLIDTFVSVINLDTGKVVRTLITEDPRKSSFSARFAFGPDGKNAVTSMSGNGLKVWDVKSGIPTTIDIGKDLPPVGVAYLPNNKQFLGVDVNGIVRLYDIEIKKFRRQFGTNEKDIGNMVASSDGARLIAFHTESFVSSYLTVWEIESGKKITLLRPEKGVATTMVSTAIFSEDGKTVLSVWVKPDEAPDAVPSSKLIAWDADTGKIRWSRTVPYRARVPCVVKGNELLIGGGPNPVDVWSVNDGKLVSSWTEHKSPVNLIAATSDGSVISAGHEPTIFVWGNGRVANRVVQTDAVTALVVSRDAKSWLVAGADGSLRHTPPDNGRSIGIATGHKGTITGLAYSAKSTWLYSASEDRTVKTWSTIDGGAIATLEGHSEGVNVIAVSPDDRWLASGSSDATIRLWPIKGGKLDADRDIIVLEGHTKAVACLAFSADGKSLITGSQDRSVKVWDWTKAKCVRTIVGHKNWVTSLLVIDANTVLTTSDDLTACLWNLNTGKEIGQVDFGIVGDCPRCVTRTTDGRVFLGTSNWLIYEMELRLPQSKAGSASSK